MISKNNYFKFASILLSIAFSFIFALIIFYIIYFLYFYVHEFGHIVYSFFINILHGQLPLFKIIMVDYPLIGYLKVPQQTILLKGVVLPSIALAGITFVTFFSLLISLILYNVYKKRAYLAFPFVFLFHEIFGNFLCGTDNLRNSTLEICSNSLLSYWIYVFYISFLILVMILLYPKILRILKDRLGGKS